MDWSNHGAITSRKKHLIPTTAIPGLQGEHLFERVSFIESPAIINLCCYPVGNQNVSAQSIYTCMPTQQITLTALRTRTLDSSKPIASDC